ncbi:hypothetical protein ES702_02580 [subsurface metagenome]
MVKAATKTDVKRINKRIDELTKTLEKLACHMKNFSEWFAFYNVRELFLDRPDLITPKYAREVLEMAKGHITYTAFQALFKKLKVFE